MNEQQIRENVKTLKSHRGHVISMQMLKPNVCTETAIRELAREGVPERYATVSHTDRRKRRSLSHVRMNKSGGVSISVLLRPVLHAGRCGLITSMAALAITRAIERHSDERAEIRWISDVICRHRCVGAAKAEGAVRGNGFLEYLILTVHIALPSSLFKTRLSDTLEEVFGGKPFSLEESISESFLHEFFDLYEELNGRHSHLEDYRDRSLIFGCTAHIRRGRKSIPVTVMGINENAQLIVIPRGEDTPILLSSPSEIIL